MNSRIREANPEKNYVDMELLVPAYLAIWNHPDNLKFLSFTGHRFTEEQVRSWFSSHVSRGIQYVVAEHAEDRSIVGIMILGRNPTHGTNIGGIGVLPSHKGQGIGKLLIRNAIDRAKSEGYVAIETEVFATNARMLRLLVGLEFVPVGMDYHRGADGTDLVQLKRYLA